MRKGKMIAQGSHASMAFLTKYAAVDSHGILTNFDEDVKNLDWKEIKEWITNSFTKVCVYVESEAELQEIHDRAWAAGLHSVMITDNGLTEFRGIPTKTCLAIGPHESSRIDAITKHLKLL